MSDPNSPERFNEEKATYAVRGADRPDLEAGVAAIRNVLKTLPARPGVYRMQDARGDVLYVGKARALKNRVTNYTQVTRLPIRLQRMVALTRSMTVVTTNNEAEALLLEAQLIKRFRPLTTCCCATTKASPSSCCARIRLSAHPAASRGAQGEGRLLRPVRRGRPGAQDAERAAETVPAAQLAPTVSSTIATGRACSIRSAAVRRPASIGSARRTMPSWSRIPGVPDRAIDPGSGEAGPADAGGVRRARLRAGGDITGPAEGAGRPSFGAVRR